MSYCSVSVLSGGDCVVGDPGLNVNTRLEVASTISATFRPPSARGGNRRQFESQRLPSAPEPETRLL